MHIGSAIGTACLTFIITNIDDAFVLVTFFAESATSRNLTPLKITIGQYVGFTVIMLISLIGFAVAVALPSEPIGFLGFLPMLLGFWKFLDLVIPAKEDEEEEDSESAQIANAKSIFKVASITVMNGGDNIGTYIPLFSQVKGSAIAVFTVVFYILVGVWCLTAFLIMRQRHILRLAEKYTSYVIPFLYIGLGIYIITKSHCFPWSIKEIDKHLVRKPGIIIMSVVTTVLLLIIIVVMVWVKIHKLNKPSANNDKTIVNENTPATTDSQAADPVVHEQRGDDGEEMEMTEIGAEPNTEKLQSKTTTSLEEASAKDEIRVTG